jgi:hypothetical protein
MNSCGSGRDSPEFAADRGGLQRIGTDTNRSEISVTVVVLFHIVFPDPPALGIVEAQYWEFSIGSNCIFLRNKQFEILVPRTLWHAGAA